MGVRTLLQKWKGCSFGGTRGMTLPEVLVASSLAVLLLGLLLVWYIQGERVINALRVRSEELQDLNHAVKVITDTFQEGAVYLLEPHSQVMAFQGDGSSQHSFSFPAPSGLEAKPPESRLLVERFVDQYKTKEVHEFFLKDGYLLHRVSVKSGYGKESEREQGTGGKSGRDAAALDGWTHASNGDQEEVLALNIEQVTFSCPVRGILEITIKGETLLLKTQVHVKEGKEEE